jgi:hypothetical protein
LPASAHVLTFLQRGYADARAAVARTPIRLAAFALLALASKWRALGQAGQFSQIVDAEHFSLYEEAARLTVTKFHELPLWNPYYCGGIPAVGTPSARFISPTFLLTLVFGTLRAEPLIWMAMTLVGLEGTYRYARANGGGSLGSALAAPMFALSGAFGIWTVYDWTNFYAFQLVPWALLGAREAFRGSRRGVVVLALAAGWMIGFGGTYAAPVTALAVAWEGLVVLAKAKRFAEVARTLLYGVVALLFVVAMSLVRLWPIAENLSSAPRVLGGGESSDLARVWHDLFGAQGMVIHHGTYLVGGALLPLFFLGALRRRALPFLASSLLWLWLALGYGAKVSLFGLLRMMPPYTMLRAPERFLPLFVLGFVVVTALALRRVEVISRRWRIAIIFAFECVAVYGWNLSVLVENGRDLAAIRPMADPPAVVDREFHQTRGNRWLAFYYFEMSRGTLACFDDYNVAESPDLRGDLSDEEYLRDTGAGTVQQKSWAPGRIEMEVDLSRPARVYVNQNWHPGWHSSQGAVTSDDGLLAVDLPAGAHDVVLRFLPRSVVVGGLTSLAALLIAFGVWRRTGSGDAFGDGRRLARQVGIFASPVLVAALGFALMRQPRRPRPALLTPEGDPLVAAAPPGDARPVGARWDSEGITLEAVRFHETGAATDDGTEVSVELDWRFDKPPPPRLGITLRIEGERRGPVSLSYAFLSGALLVDDAPLHTTLRDVTESILLPHEDLPRTVQVSVQLSVLRGNGEPLTDVVVDGVRASQGRVLVGPFNVP